MKQDNSINVGLGFATGRKGFQNVLLSYMYHLQETKMLEKPNIDIHLFVAYDLDFSDATIEDFTELDPYLSEQFSSVHFIGEEDIRQTVEELVKAGVIEPEESALCFGNGYAAKRNIIVYEAMRQQIDYLLFLDDDEYPMAVTRSKESALWSGQHAIEAHVRYLKFSDVTNGYHCGYISPIPYIEFDNIVSEDDFRLFIEAISNDVINWEDIKTLMDNGGITYADKEVLIQQNASLVEEVQGAKFITGGNLGLNLTRPEKLYPFYNPPGARGEDTFLSTCLQDVTVKRIPVYTFHDGFAFYETLLHGVLPTRLKQINTFGSYSVIERFYRACIGWIRYKPLYTYITRRSEYREIIDDIKRKLSITVPKICSYFNVEDFANIETELNKYDSHVVEHFQQFEDTKRIWEKVKSSIIPSLPDTPQQPDVVLKKN